MHRKLESATVSTSDLDKVPLLANLDQRTKSAIVQKTKGLRAQATQEIISYLDTSDSVFFVLEGHVRVNMISAGGRQITYQLLGPGDMFGEMAALDGLPRSASVIAESNVLLIEMGGAQFVELITNHASLVLPIMRRLTSLSRWLSARVFEYHAYNVRGRVYLELMRLADGIDTPHPLIKISDRDMASRVGTTRENVTRICGELKQNGVIQRDAKGMVILDPVALNELLEACEFS